MRIVPLIGVLVGACGSHAVTPKARTEARQIWTERCANCHGQRGQGDGPGAVVLDPKPRDFTESSWQLKTTDEQIARVIVDGGRAAGLSEQMAANADLASKPAVVAALVEHLRSLAMAP